MIGIFGNTGQITIVITIDIINLLLAGAARALKTGMAINMAPILNNGQTNPANAESNSASEKFKTLSNQTGNISDCGLKIID